MVDYIEMFEKPTLDSESISLQEMLHFTNWHDMFHFLAGIELIYFNKEYKLN